MREILFRGKTLDKGEWVYGVPVIAKDNIADKDITVMVDNPNEIVPREGLPLFEQVDPETVGQYTGLKDRNGTRIFEGDIVNCNYFCGVVYFYEGAWCVSEKDKYPEDLYDLISLEVIGNIHDNKNLLKNQEVGE